MKEENENYKKSTHEGLPYHRNRRQKTILVLMMWMSCLIDFSCFGKYVYIYILSQARNRRGEEMGDKFPLMEIFFKHIERKKTKKSPPHQIFSHKKFENPPIEKFCPWWKGNSRGEIQKSYKMFRIYKKFTVSQMCWKMLSKNFQRILQKQIDLIACYNKWI